MKFPHRMFWSLMAWYFVGRAVSDLVVPVAPYWLTLTVYGAVGFAAYQHAQRLTR